jgi:tRNA A37 methylthiotransferase MiaB
VTRKLYIRTFGCQMNEYDSAKMADVLHEADGLEPTDRPDDADVILFNTCSVREKAQQRVFHDLGRVRALKDANPDLIIGVGGCVASQEGAAIVARAPYVDVVFGPQTLHRLPELIARTLQLSLHHQMLSDYERLRDRARIVVLCPVTAPTATWEMKREHIEGVIESSRAATAALLAQRGSKLLRHSGIHYLDLR